jgi:hypothetical protein
MVFFQDSILGVGLVLVVLCLFVREKALFCAANHFVKQGVRVQIFILKMHFYSNGLVCIFDAKCNRF